MKRLILLTVVVLISSCANKSDPGLEQPPAKLTVIDSLKGKTPVQILKLKYSSAVAVCKLDRIIVNPDGSIASGDVDHQESNVLEINLKDWSESDPPFKTGDYTIVNAADGLSVVMQFTPEFAFVDFTEKKNNFVYLARYSPQVKFKYTASIDGADGSTHGVSGLIRERLLSSVKVAAVTHGKSATAKNYEFILTCGIETTVDEKSKHAEEFEAQFETLDCNEPKDSQKDLAAKNCKS